MYTLSEKVKRGKHALWTSSRFTGRIDRSFRPTSSLLWLLRSMHLRLLSNVAKRATRVFDKIKGTKLHVRLFTLLRPIQPHICHNYETPCKPSEYKYGRTESSAYSSIRFQLLRIQSISKAYSCHSLWCHDQSCWSDWSQSSWLSLRGLQYSASRYLVAVSIRALQVHSFPAHSWFQTYVQYVYH